MSDIEENTENKTDIGQANNDGTTMSFVRVTTYTKSKVITSTTTPKKRIKKSKPFEKSSKKKSAPAKRILAKINPNSSIKRFLIKRPDNKLPEAIIPFGISSKCDDFRSKFPNYPWNKNDPLPGDLEMAIAGDIGLSGHEQIKEIELIFRKARCSTYVNTYIGNDDLDTNRFS